MISSSVTVVTDRRAFADAWRDALARVGLSVAEVVPSSAIGAAGGRHVVIIDALAGGYDEDELLAAAGFVAACGGLPIVALPPHGAHAGAADVLEDLSGALVARGDDVARVAAAIARRVDASRAGRFEYVTTSPGGPELLAIFGDGRAVLLPRPLGPADDGGELVSISLADDARTATVELASGKEVVLSAATVSAPRASNGQSHGTNGTIPLDGPRLGARLRTLRKKAGLTQAELARRTGIHRPNIARVEAGRHTPSLDTLARIATAIGVPTTRVLEADPEPAPTRRPRPATTKT